MNSKTLSQLSKPLMDKYTLTYYVKDSCSLFLVSVPITVTGLVLHLSFNKYFHHQQQSSQVEGLVISDCEITSQYIHVLPCKDMLMVDQLQV